MDFQEIVTEINNAFFRLESFMNGTISNYQYFNFNEKFTKLFVEARKPENFNYSNCKLIGEYWKLTEQIKVDYDKSDFDNTEAYDNEMFCKDCEEIEYLNWERIDEFIAFSTPDEIAESERKFSITDILKASALPTQQTETKKDKITAPVLGLFCTLINKTGINQKGITESATVYCQRICLEFRLPYTDRVRQNYNINETKKLVKELKQIVLPKINTETKILIEKYLDKNQPSKQNLYA